VEIDNYEMCQDWRSIAKGRVKIKKKGKATIRRGRTRRNQGEGTCIKEGECLSPKYQAQVKLGQDQKIFQRGGVPSVMNSFGGKETGPTPSGGGERSFEGESPPMG